jgi:hypothetical protein
LSLWTGCLAPATTHTRSRGYATGMGGDRGQRSRDVPVHKLRRHLRRPLPEQWTLGLPVLPDNLLREVECDLLERQKRSAATATYPRGREETGVGTDSVQPAAVFLLKERFVADAHDGLGTRRATVGTRPPPG